MIYVNPGRLPGCCNDITLKLQSLEAAMYTAILSVLSVLAAGLIAGVFISALLALEESPSR
jgi:flagellar biosynthesis protein FliQ